MNRDDGAFVVSSDVAVDPVAADALAVAFRHRLRLVEGARGFQRLEVWQDVTRPGVFTMVSWWDSEADFRGYMRSPEHRASHARIDRGPHRPRGTGVRRYVVLGDDNPRMGSNDQVSSQSGRHE